LPSASTANVRSVKRHIYIVVKKMHGEEDSFLQYAFSLPTDTKSNEDGVDAHQRIRDADHMQVAENAASQQ
jgi:mannosyltransferase OCH1-like enzyme